ncbi:MAG: hypothetical protein M5R36_04895 [Deltaproteobacteria bacterium]|nr:hypothetical protein [Deltaproteobacteria bacterium]
MAKISVLDAAQEIDLHPQEFLKKLKELGIYADDVQATIDEDALPRVRALLREEKKREKEQAGFVESRIGTTVIRRRSRPRKRKSAEEVAAEEAEAPPEAEETEEAETGEETVAEPEEPEELPLAAAEEPAPEPPAETLAPRGEVSEEQTMVMSRGRRSVRVLDLRGRTPEPARVVARPPAPSAPARPARPAARPARPGGVPGRNNRRRHRRPMRPGPGPPRPARRGNQPRARIRIAAQIERAGAARDAHGIAAPPPQGF